MDNLPFTYSGDHVKAPCNYRVLACSVVIALIKALRFLAAQEALEDLTPVGSQQYLCL